MSDLEILISTTLCILFKHFLGLIENVNIALDHALIFSGNIVRFWKVEAQFRAVKS